MAIYRTNLIQKLEIFARFEIVKLRKSKAERERGRCWGYTINISPTHSQFHLLNLENKKHVYPPFYIKHQSF